LGPFVSTADLADGEALYLVTTPCPRDCGNGDGTVGVADLLAVLAQWGQVGTPCDVTGNGVGVDDFLALLGHWGACPWARRRRLGPLQCRRAPMLLFAVPVTIALLCGLLAARGARRLRPHATIRSVHRELPLVAAVPIAAVLLAGALIAVQAWNRLGRELPLWLQRWAPDLFWTGILCAASFLCAFLAGFAWLQRLPRRRLLVVMVAALELALVTTAWRLRRPIAADLAGTVAPQGYVTQTTPQSCAPAAIATIANLYGGSVSERDAALLLRTTASGTTPGQMRYALARLGFSVSDVSTNPPDVGSVLAPAILFVRHPSLGPGPHTVAYLGRRGAAYEIWDPMLGRRLMAESELDTIWTGRGLECRPPGLTGTSGMSTASD
jgi:hypothetical protein